MDRGGGGDCAEQTMSKQTPNSNGFVHTAGEQIHCR